MKTRKRLSLSVIIVPALLGAFTFLAVSYRSQDPAGVPAPPYEEIHTSDNAVRRWTRKINYAVYEALSRSGTRDQDVLFMEIHPRYGDGHVWEFAELSVTCPDARSAQRLRGVLARKLSELGPDVVVRTNRGLGDERVLRISVGDFGTHRIHIDFDHRPKEPDVRPKIAIIVDDLGYRRDIAVSFLEMKMPITYSVLPMAPFTRDIVNRLTQGGHEFMLHLPMEPKNYPAIDPGPGALLTSMDEKAIKKTLLSDLERTPGVKGVNNHMGSSFTENEDKMRTLLEELRGRKLFYIDSRTTGETVGLKVAKEIGVPAARRGVFLDNDLDARAIKIQWERLLSVSRHRGAAIGICHPHEETLEVLRRIYPAIREEYQVVRASELVG